MNKTNGLKYNLFMYFIRLISNFGFIILIFPYVARKIGAEGIGRVQYVEVINSYFLLVINLGVLDYGKREIACSKDNLLKANDIVNELLSILCITTLFGSIFYFIFIIYVESKMDKILLCIYFFIIILNLINLEWFYIGIENQEYITKRNLLIKIVSGILILLLVKEQKDIYLYAGILVLATAGSNFYNFIELKKYAKLKLVGFKEYKRHLKPLFYLFSSSLALSLSYNLDSLYDL